MLLNIVIGTAVLLNYVTRYSNRWNCHDSCGSFMSPLLHYRESGFGQVNCVDVLYLL